MKSSFKRLPGSTVLLEVTLSGDEFKSYWQSAYDAAAQKIEIKGFRPGGAPKELLGQAVDKEKVFDAAAHEAVRKSLHEVMEIEQWTIIDAPRIEILEASPVGASGLRYKATLALFPEVRLGAYKEIARRVFDEKRDLSVRDEEISRSLDLLRASRAAVTRATHEARVGDVIEADVKSHAEGKNPFVTNHDQFVLGESHWFPEFDRAIEGHREGDEFTFSLVPPQQTASITFTVKVNGVFDRTLPELTDAFAQSLGNQFKNIQDLRASVRDGLRLEKEERERERKQIKILQEIRDSSTIDLPGVMIEKELERQIAEFKSHAQGADASEEKLREAFRERARNTLKTHLVVYQIVKQEHLEPTPEEVLQEMKRQHIDDEKYYDYIYNTLQTKKLFAFLEKNHA